MHAHKCARSGSVGDRLCRALPPTGHFLFRLCVRWGKTQPYVESDECSALNVYGESKVAADRCVLSGWPGALIIRPGTIFEPFAENNFLREQLRALARGERVRVANDIKISMTYLPELVQTTLDLLIDGETGVWHLAHPGIVTPEQLLTTAAGIAGIDTRMIEGVPIWSLRHPALRPRFRALDSERGQFLPPLDETLQRYCHESPAFDEEVDAVAIR